MDYDWCSERIPEVKLVYSAASCIQNTLVLLPGTLLWVGSKLVYILSLNSPGTCLFSQIFRPASRIDEAKHTLPVAQICCRVQYTKFWQVQSLKKNRWQNCWLVPLVIGEGFA